MMRLVARCTFDVIGAAGELDLFPFRSFASEVEASKLTRSTRLFSRLRYRARMPWVRERIL